MDAIATASAVSPDGSAQATKHLYGTPPSKLEDLGRILDLYYYEPVDGGPVPAERTGGAGAYAYYGVPTRADLGGTPLAGFVDRLHQAISATFPKEDEFRITFEGVTFRGCRDHSGLTTEVALRRVPDNVPKLSDLRFDNPITPALMEGPWLERGGLVVLCGLSGQGKTTLGSAMLHSRLDRYGGRAVTVEDPLELPLEGTVGTGACRQLEVTYEGNDAWRRGFAGAIRRAYRKLPATRPAILFVGEVRDTETAAELLKASLNGMLVITTLHAHDPIAAITRLASMAARELGDSAPILLGQALRMVLHHRLVLSADATGWQRGEFFADSLVSDSDIHPVAHAIKNERYAQLNQVKAFQLSVLRNSVRMEHSAGQYLADVGRNSQGMQGFAQQQGG